MKIEDVPQSLIEEFERGYAPGDEPPGLEEAAYHAWKLSGGTVKAAPEQPAVWAIVELMGHVRLAGRLTEEEKFGSKMGRLDIPQGDGFVTQLFGGGSVYRITIATEQVARQVCRQTSPAPVSPWDFPKQLPPLAPSRMCGGCDRPIEACVCEGHDEEEPDDE